MSEAYERDSIFLAYVKWHYGKGLRELLGVSRNFLWFVAHFFSFRLLSKTLFIPWKRLGESYEGGLDLGKYASTFIVNSLMRAVGLVTRSVVLIIGVASYLFVLAVSVLAFLIWFLAPAVLIGSLLLSATFFSI